MKQALRNTSIIFVFIMSLTSCNSNEDKQHSDYFIGPWYYLDYSSNDSIADYGEILITDSTFTIAYITTGLGPFCEVYEIQSDSIYISREFKYLTEKIDQNSFTLKYKSSDKDSFIEMNVMRMKKHEFGIKEEFANFEELDIYFENAFKRSKKYTDQGNKD